ncbi:MAG: hypothetical protein PHD12_00940 [Methylotenera sp.]|nr:hypothetical protein [Methylotenera sp.]
MVYEKSAIGFNEFIAKNRTLNVRERQILLLVNGERTLDDLGKFFKKDLLIDTIHKLESTGYIIRPNQQQPLQPKQITHSVINTQVATAPICQNQLTEVKEILIKACDDYLGIIGRNIKSRIEACENEIDLKSCISNWHMAMRESKLGRESASFLMEQIHQTLVHKTSDSPHGTRLRILPLKMESASME